MRKTIYACLILLFCMFCTVSASAKNAYQMYVSDMVWEEELCYNNPVTRNTAHDGTPLSLGNGAFMPQRGIGMHPFSGAQENSKAFVRISLENLGMKLFSATVGNNDDATYQYASGSVIFTVLVDGEVKAQTGVMHRNETHTFYVDVENAKELILQVDNADGSHAFDTATWGDAVLYSQKCILEMQAPNENLAQRKDAFTASGIAIQAEQVKLYVNDVYVGNAPVENDQWKYTFRNVDGDSAIIRAEAMVGNEVQGSVQKTIKLKNTEELFFEYISDLEWLSAKGNDNAVVRDATFSGGVLKIGGGKYTTQHGIQLHPFPGAEENSYADVVVSIDGWGYTQFEAFVGKADEANHGVNTAVRFQVLADDVVVADSGNMMFGEYKKLTANIENAKILTLRLTNGGDDYGYDSACWCDAKILKQTNDTIYISDMPWESATSYDHAPQRNTNHGGESIIMGNGSYITNKGIGLHPFGGAESESYADITIDIENMGYRYFSSRVGKDDGTAGGGDLGVRFCVLLDGVVVAESRKLGFGETEWLEADVTGGKKLTLRLTNGGDDHSWDSSSWGDALLSKTFPELHTLSERHQKDVYASMLYIRRNGMFYNKETPVHWWDTVSVCANIVNRTEEDADICLYFVTYDESGRLISVLGKGYRIPKNTPLGQRIETEEFQIAEGKNGTIKVLAWQLPQYKPANSIEVQAEENNGMNILVHARTTEKEKQRARAQVEAYLSDHQTIPVSYTIGGKQYFGLGGDDFSFIEKTTMTEGEKETTVLRYQHKSGVELKLLFAYYPNYAAFDQTLYFINPKEATQNTPIIADVNAADIYFEGGSPILSGIYGDGGGANGISNAPYSIDVAKTDVRQTPNGGMATNGYFPYYQFSYGNGGALIAIGWSVQWEAAFSYKEGKTHFTAGQECFASYLKPGETARTPLVAFVLYDGRDDDRIANLWRHWFIDCNMRKVDDALFPPAQSAATSSSYGEMVYATESNQIADFETYRANGINLDWWWMDAGWYFRRPGETLPLNWLETGSWLVDTNRFPTSFRAISDHVGRYGAKTLLWFEPELLRMDNSLLSNDGTTMKKEWLLHYNTPHYSNGSMLVDMGNPEAVDWIFNRVCSIIDAGNISMYRQDYGHTPLGDFTVMNTLGREGIAENKYVQGYLSYWDRLIERYPNMMIDSCAAGGRRNDLETMRRSVPLHKSDGYYGEHELKQSTHHSLFKWFPYFGAVVTSDSTKETPYALQSSNVPFPVHQLNMNTNPSFQSLQHFQTTWTKCKDYFYDDYYTLTEWTTDSTKWLGWEFIDTAEGKGFIQLYRHVNAGEAEKQIYLKGLIAEENYTLCDEYGVNLGTFSGKTLMESGVRITIPQKESGLVIFIN